MFRGFTHRENNTNENHVYGFSGGINIQVKSKQFKKLYFDIGLGFIQKGCSFNFFEEQQHSYTEWGFFGDIERAYTTTTKTSEKYRLNYIELPIQFKFKTNSKHFNFFFFFGLVASSGLSCTYEMNNQYTNTRYPELNRDYSNQSHGNFNDFEINFFDLGIIYGSELHFPKKNNSFILGLKGERGLISLKTNDDDFTFQNSGIRIYFGYGISLTKSSKNK